MLDYSDYVTIKIIKVKDEVGKFSHWESQIQFSDNWYSSSVTGPDYYSVVNEALEHIRSLAQYWTIEENNEKKN